MDFEFELNKLLSLESNKNCIDCLSPNPKWVSINNAVFLCSECAKNHLKLPSEISRIKSIEVDDFTEEEISLLKLGGNDRFFSIMTEYEITQNPNKEYKYCLKIFEYYRMLLECELHKDTHPEAFEQAIKIKPSPQIALQLMDNINSNYIYNQSNLNNGFNNFFQTFTNVISNVGNKIQGTAHQFGIDEKITNFSNYVSEGFKNFNDSHPEIKSFGDKAVQYAKNAGNFVVEKGKEIYNSETVQNMTHKAEEQYNALKEKAINSIK
jgi:hypothetical protein